MRWTGNGLADGTVITAANVNAPGNGATVTFSTSGTGTITTEGYGFRVANAASSGIRRLDATVSGTGARVQVGITPGEFPNATASFVMVRTSSATQVSLLLNTDGSIQISANGVVTASKTPVVAAGDTLLIDLVVAQHTSPTTSNGRVFYRVRNLTNTSWATGGEFFYDSGYTLNIGTEAYASIRYGKMATEVIGSTGILYEYLGWEPISVSTADTSREQAEAYFLAPAVIAVTATGGVTLGGTAAAFVGVSVPANGALGLSGTATAVELETTTANGSITLTLTGIAASVARELRTVSATLTLAGTAAVSAREARNATGVLVLTGTTGTVTQHARTAIGTLTATGYATGYAPSAQRVYLGDAHVTLKIGDHPVTPA